jgi:hypothetical protein
MMSRLALAVVCLVLIHPASSRAFDENVGKDRIGVRTGAIITSDGFNDAYGNGWDLTILYNHRVTHHFLLDFRLGALYPGDLLLEELDDELMHQTGIQGSMRLYYLSAGVMVGRSIAGGYSMDLAAGAGIYSVSMVFTNSISPYDFSQQKFGVNGGLGLARRISTNWSLEANGTVHYFMIEENIDDIYFAFTDGADAPLLLDITLGVVIDLR